MSDHETSGDRWHGALTEKQEQIEASYPADEELVLDLVREVIDSADDEAKTVLACMFRLARQTDAPAYDQVLRPHLDRVIEDLAERRLKAREKTDGGFSQFISTGKWPAEGP